MNNDKLGLFNGEDKPSVDVVWDFYKEGLRFNNAIDLDDTVKSNENFFIGRQWEGVQANGLPTPVFNILKRVVGFVTATITTDNLKVTATPLANSAGTESYQELARVVTEEMEAIMEQDSMPAKIREFAQDAAVRGDGCMYTYWDPTAKVGGGAMGRIRHAVLKNTRVLFGDPNNREVQSQPYIQIVSRNLVREVKIRAKNNGISDWRQITEDDEATQEQDDAKRVNGKCTVILILWRSDEDGTIWAYESTQNCEVKKPWSLGITRYPLIWMNWDRVADCYHGQAMITGLIPNQIFINKAYAMAMLSMMRTAWPKYVFDRSRITRLDNRVGSAIGVDGDPHNAIAIVDPLQINPQIAQFIQMAIEETQESLGATASALGEGKAYNTSAILSLQRAAATPNEMIKQRLYEAVEEQAYIDEEFMGEYFGTRMVDTPTPPQVREAFDFVGQTQDVPSEVPMPFDFSILKENPLVLKLDVGASSYYSEIAAMQTLDNLLQGGQIDIVEYLERVPDSYVPGRRKLIADKREQKRQQEMLQAQQAMMMGMPPEMAMSAEGQEPPQAGSVEGPMLGNLKQDVEITGGRGYGAAARAINGTA